MLYPNAALPDTGIDELVKMAMAQGQAINHRKTIIFIESGCEGIRASTYIEMMTLNARTLIGS